MLRILGLLFVLVVATSQAHAQRAPDMATLDRGDGISKFGIDLGLTALDSPFYSAALRLDIYGQYVTDSGFGFYGSVPISRSFGGADDPTAPQNATAFGNLELGLLFVVTNSPTVSWVFRGGIALPTADDDGDGALTNFFATWPRLTDLALTEPRSLNGRFSFSPLIHLNRTFLRFDLGLDIGSNDDTLADELLRINVGAGYDFGVVALSLELANIAALDDFGEDEAFLHTLAFTVRFMGEQLQPFLSFGVPLDDSIRDQVSFFVAGGLVIAQ
ncbi:MAG: hypothetical protein H0X17_14295 [Deltaproteobacteria bacterium]|nr:hypothetical protein [Deltaproteobacteria bacterium]